MKKFIAMLLALTLVASFAASTMAAPKKKVVKKKVVKKVVKPVKKPAVKKPALQPVTPWVPPTPAPVAPAPVAAPAAAGMGMSIGGSVGTIAGLTGVVGYLDYSIASMLPGTKLTVGGAYLSGSNGVDTSLKVVTLKVGAKYALDMLKQPGLPVDFYLMGAVDVPVKVSSGFSGSYGLEAGIGANYMIPDFGTLNGELGYSALKYGGLAGAAKGVLVTVGYAYSF